MFASICRSLPALFFLFFLIATSPSHAVVVNTVGGLQSAINSANSGGDKTILIADGTYNLNDVVFFIDTAGVTVRGQSGNRDAVILDSNYMEGGTSGIFRIVASNVTIADLTLKRPYQHAIHVSPGGAGDITGILIDNVHIIDPGEQAIKINADTYDNPSFRANNGIIQNCLMELTDIGRTKLTSPSNPCYTGGVDGHWAQNWTIRDNVIKGFWCADSLSEHGIHFWSDSVDILVERNLIYDCDRGIGFGLGDRGNRGGIIRNNMIYHGPDHGVSDVGISLESSTDAQVYNNTVFHQHSYSAIEYRFGATTNALIVNNLTNRQISLRDGASGQVQNNVTNAQESWFANAAAGNLHLTGSLSGVADSGQAVSGLADDFDQEKRPQGSGIDIGADEIVQKTGKGLSWLMLLFK